MGRRKRSERGPIACDWAPPALFSEDRARPGGWVVRDLDWAMERNLFKYIWRHSWRDQVYILVIVALLQVFYFISLDLPKRIVNDGIRGDAFKKADVHTLPFMHVSVGPYPSIGLPEVTLFGGIPLDQM